MSELNEDTLTDIMTALSENFAAMTPDERAAQTQFICDFLLKLECTPPTEDKK